ncbi:hypothetical protein Kpol_1037p57 [Vanderwaltozyma polyspora DSM 70294]|uniref:Factor-induced gene 1 protein n=1 Tax=Vanderwaltozyma polyspora (strain ATCC 22028 / DSM 70294 / BCRC 21397 / CBS 2163 / NBRC 10782 / NRRL Y-8283 / UCD 57-17) TaxID=436907 RepID=A7TJZ8_VANPO|nr:uncharacterized protein Kpol_1037p57 [Vanderwaltozyma polyspora DSM 70294]EDO17460.1 hypothetical protein Kpol_1037p57 [Vanderwaltozyma polyspora DSM 70294]
MFTISALWFCMKRMPRILALCFNFITIFLTVFLLIGCYSTHHDSTFLVRYKFNSESSFYPVLQNSFATESAETKGLEKIVVKSGYMGICIDKIPSNFNSTSKTICYSRSAIEKTKLYNDVSLTLLNIQSTNSTSTPSKINILELAKLTSDNVIHPYVLMATIVLTILMFILLVYVTVPYELPFKLYINQLLLVWSSALVLLWGMGATSTHIGAHASKDFIPAASLGIISVHVGKKAGTMAWFSFAFLLIDCLILWYLYIRNRKSISQAIDEVHQTTSNPFDDKLNVNKNTNNNYGSYYKYGSDSSTLHSKV